jgi:hypothetical protein
VKLQHMLIFVPILLLAVNLSGCGGGGGGTPVPTPTPSSGSYGNPGLREAGGAPHIMPAAHATTGSIINVTLPPYNADPADNASDDRPAIEAAINAAQAGDEIYFPNGTYNLITACTSDANSNIRLKSGVNLRGESETGAVLKSSLNHSYIADPDLTLQPSINYSVIRAYAVQNITISSLTITSTWSGAYSISTGVNNPAAGGPTYGISLTNGTGTLLENATSNITIENVTVEKFRRHGISVRYGCHDVTVRDCTARNATDVGGGGAGYGFVIQGYNHQTTASNPFLGTIKDTYWNLIDGCHTTGSYIRHAMILQSWTHNNLITNCNFSGTRIDAIDLHGEDEYENEVSYNTITGTVGEAAIAMGNSGGTSHDKSGPYNWIHHNTIINCKEGITCEYGSELQLIEDNEIRGAASYSNGYGIGLGKTNGTMVRNNNIHDNTVSGFKAIYLYHNTAMNEEPAGDPTNCIVQNNILTNNTTNSVVRGTGISDVNWATNTIQ